MFPPLAGSKAIRAATEHREQWPLPASPWLMVQSWYKLLFAHWPVPVTMLRPHIPASLTIDTFDGEAWLGVVPFEIRGMRMRGLPPLPGFNGFPELNVRTYVTHEDKPGVWFFSLDADHALAVMGARLFFRLPYFKAKMRVQAEGAQVRYDSQRTHPGAAPAVFRASYRPVSEIYYSQPGTLDYWLTERYYLYTADKRGRVYRGPIHHHPWPLQRAEAEIEQETTAASHGLRLPDTPPLLHYADLKDVLIWMIERV